MYNYTCLYPDLAITSKKPQEIINGVGMLEGNITMPTCNMEGNKIIRNAIIYIPVNVHRTEKL